MMKIQEVPVDGQAHLICDEAIHIWELFCNSYIHKNKFSPDDYKSQQDYEDDLYSTAHSLAMTAIQKIEKSGDYDFSDYDEDGEIAWYDEAREWAISDIMAYLAG